MVELESSKLKLEKNKELYDKQLIEVSLNVLAFFSIFRVARIGFFPIKKNF